MRRKKQKKREKDGRHQARGIKTKPKKIFENKTADEEREAEEEIKERKNKNRG